MVKGTEQSSVEYEITEFEVDQVLRTAGWIEASAGVLSYAHSATGAQLKLTDGQIVDVSIGCFIVNGSPSRASSRRLVKLNGEQRSICCLKVSAES